MCLTIDDETRMGDLKALHVGNGDIYLDIHKHRFNDKWYKTLIKHVSIHDNDTLFTVSIFDLIITRHPTYAEAVPEYNKIQTLAQAKELYAQHDTKADKPTSQG